MALIGLAGVVVGTVGGPLINTWLKIFKVDVTQQDLEDKVKKLQAELDQQKNVNVDLQRNNSLLLDKELKDHSSLKLISLQLLAVDMKLKSHVGPGYRPVIEILGINATGPLHQGKEMLETVLRSKENKGYGGTVRILLLDPNSDAFKGPEGRARSEKDNVGRIAAELNASLYILAEIADHLGPEAATRLEVKSHRKPPDRSLFMVDACASTTSKTLQEIMAECRDGMILENMYPSRLRAERGLLGSSAKWSQSQREYYEGSLKYFRDLWKNADPVAIPKRPFEMGRWPD